MHIRWRMYTQFEYGESWVKVACSSFFIRYIFFHFLAAHAAISPPRSKSSDNLAELSRSTPRSCQYCNFLRFNSSEFYSVPSVQRLILKILTLEPFMFQTPQVISKGFCSHHKKYMRQKLSLALLALKQLSLIDYQDSDSVLGSFSTIPFSIAVSII